MVRPYTITTSLGKGLYRLECAQAGAVVNRVKGFYLKPFHAGDDAEANSSLNSAEQKDGFDGDEQEKGLDGNKWQSSFNGNEQADGLDELVDSHWLSCDAINRAQSFSKKQFPQQNGLKSTTALKEGKKWKSVPE